MIFILFWIPVKAQIFSYNFRLIIAAEVQLAGSSPFLFKLMKPFIGDPLTSVNDWTT